jgi:hypothetical protein
MPVGERDNDAVGREAGDSRQRIRGKTGLGLFAVGYDGRTGLFETLDGVAECGAVGVIEGLLTNGASLKSGYRLQESSGTRNAADGFGDHFVFAAPEVMPQR